MWCDSAGDKGGFGAVEDCHRKGRIHRQGNFSVDFNFLIGVLTAHIHANLCSIGCSTGMTVSTNVVDSSLLLGAILACFEIQCVNIEVDWRILYKRKIQVLLICIWKSRSICLINFKAR